MIFGLIVPGAVWITGKIIRMSHSAESPFKKVQLEPGNYCFWDVKHFESGVVPMPGR